MADLKLGLVLASYFIAFFISGVYYLSIANNYTHKWNGILKGGDIYTKSTCSTNCNSKGKNCHTSCSNTYYVEQIFYKGPNTVNTCTVTRLTPYYYKGSANGFVERMKLGTMRTIYQTSYSAGVCFDEKIRYQWNVYGGVFLSLSLLPIVVLLFIIVTCFVEENFQSCYSSISNLLESLYTFRRDQRMNNMNNPVNEFVYDKI